MRLMNKAKGSSGNFPPYKGRVGSRRAAPESRHPCGTRSAAAVVPQIDHRVGKRLEGVVHGTDALEAQQQAAKFVLPGEHALDGTESLIENGRVEQRLATALRGAPAPRIGVDVGRHASIEDRLAVGPAVVHAIQTDDGAP